LINKRAEGCLWTGLKKMETSEIVVEEFVPLLRARPHAISAISRLRFNAIEIMTVNAS